VEIGCSDAKSLILKRQSSFLTKRIARDDFANSPLDLAIRIATAAGSPTYGKTNEYYNKHGRLPCGQVFANH
jgi:hypothetical protein